MVSHTLLQMCYECVKAEVKCSIAFHRSKNVHGSPICPNISSAGTQGQKGLKIENRKEKA